MLNNIEHIRESGLLELYVLGELTPSEITSVEAALELFPALKTDLKDIEKALHTYAEAHALEAPQSVLNKVLSETKTTQQETIDPEKPNAGISKLMTFALLAALGTILFQFFSNRNLASNQEENLNIANEKCSEEKDALLYRLEQYKELDKPNNTIIQVAPTEKYPQTEIVFNSNSVTKRNFLQFKSLPKLEPNQSYQLWSLKDNSDPIPLNVFENIDELLEVEFVNDTNAYAITIEPKGGQESPTLENLIGVFSMKG